MYYVFGLAQIFLICVELQYVLLCHQPVNTYSGMLSFTAMVSNRIDPNPAYNPADLRIPETVLMRIYAEWFIILQHVVYGLKICFRILLVQLDENQEFSALRIYSHPGLIIKRWKCIL